MKSDVTQSALEFPGSDVLADTALLGFDNSHTHCTESCRAYHAAWGYLRLFGKTSGVDKDGAFLSSALRDQVSTGARRVLICGSADHGILAYVLEAFGEAPVDITVIDLCPTPLATCRWYAEQKGHMIETMACDALTLEVAPFDLIVAHNFLNFFNSQDRIRLANKWFDLLQPGGRVLSFSSLKPGAPESSHRVSPSKIEPTVHRMMLGRAASPHSELISADALDELVRKFSAQRISHNLRTAQEVEAPFFMSGFDVTRRQFSIEGDDRAAIPVHKERICLIATRT